MTYLVTGGTGFIGSYVCRDLVHLGERVVAYDLLPSRDILGKILTKKQESELTIEQGDISDFDGLGRVVQKHKVDRIIHLASMLHPASNENPVLAEKVNTLGTANVFECARLLGVIKIVWASSMVVFGPPYMYPQEYLPNDAPHAPPHVYGATKSHCEFLANHYRKTWEIDHIGLRFTIVYGPGRVRGATAFIQKLMIEPALGRSVTLPYGDGEIDWQFVEDIAALTVKCSQIGKTRTSIFNTKFDVRSIREAASYVKSIIPDADITLLPGTLGLSCKLDDSLLQSEIGFTPQYPMERGILETMNFVRRQAGLPPLEEKA